jgi:hypothetical protein
VGVKIEAVPDSCRLRVSGDVETVLSVPFEDDDRFLVGLSDGTLLVGSYDEELHCRFDVARHGAGIVQFDRGTAIVDFRVDWATVSAFDANVVEPPAPASLPLFPELSGYDANY